MKRSGTALFVVLLCAAVTVADPAETRSRIQAHLQNKEYATAVEVARAIDDPVGRSVMLLGVAQAQLEGGERFAADESFELAAEATRAIPDPTERVLRVAALAWIHERRFEDHLCSTKGGVHDTAAKLLEEAGKGFAGADRARMQTLVASTTDPADRLHSAFVMATILHASGNEEAARKLMQEACVAVAGVPRLDVRARLLLEAANMSRWMGDEEGGTLRMRDARVSASGIEQLNARLGLLRVVADSYAAIRSRDGINATMPALLAGLEALPAQARDGKAGWLMHLAKLQSQVQAHEEIRETLDRFESAVMAAANEYGMNTKIREVLDEAADLRLSNRDVDGFMRYAKQRCTGVSDRNNYYEQRVRWLLGLRSGKTGDLLSGIGGRKPTAMDMNSGIAVADAIQIKSAPFRPAPGKRAASGRRDDASDRRDGLFGDIVDRGVELGHLSAAETACARLVDPEDMAESLMDVARARIEAGERATAQRLLDPAWWCLESLAPEASKAALVQYAVDTLRGAKYADLARLYNDAGKTDRALEALDRLRDMYKHAKTEGSRYMLAQYLTSAHSRIGDAFNAKRYCAQFIEIVVAAKNPFQGLMDATIPLDLSGYTDGVRACLDRAQTMADDTSVPVATRFDRYLRLAAARNGKLEDGSGEAPASAALRLAAASTDADQRKVMLNRVVGDCTLIGAPNTLLAAYDLLRPFKSEDERNRTLLASVDYVCKQSFRRLHLGGSPIRAATALSDACTDARVRATGYMSIVSGCYRDRRVDDGDRMLAKLRAMPESGTFRPKQSIEIAMAEWVASYHKSDDAELSLRLWESAFARLVNAPEDETDDRLASRATTLARLGNGRTPEFGQRGTEAANAMAKRISDDAKRDSILEQLSPPPE